MSFKLGLTGSIGMGKSTTAALFAEAGCKVWDADAAVHRLYQNGGAAVDPIGELYPDAIVDGSVLRERLRDIIARDPAALQQIEHIVHPLVADDRADFIGDTQADILVFDIPLLFETGGDAAMDAVAVVHVDSETQKQRVLARGTMTEAQFEAILAKQMPIAEKLVRADFTIETDTLEHAKLQVQTVVEAIKNRI
ncbi:MAG: dephospho-CoA kinase [Tateyamaria sp.]